VRFGHGQKRIKSGTEGSQFILIELSVDGSRSYLSREGGAQTLVQVFLKAGDVDIKPKNFRREWVLTGKSLSAIYTTLPGGNRHRLIVSSVAIEMPGAVTGPLRRWL
jgi:hypothetical protein